MCLYKLVVLPSLNSNLSLPLMTGAHCWFDSVSKTFKVDTCFRSLIYQFMQLAKLSGLFTFPLNFPSTTISLGNHNRKLDVLNVYVQDIEFPGALYSEIKCTQT